MLSFQINKDAQIVAVVVAANAGLTGKQISASLNTTGLNATETKTVRLLCHALVFILCFAICLVLSANPVAAQEQTRAWDRAALNSAILNTESAPLYKNSHALLIGASQYDTWPSLNSIPSELDDVQRTLEAQQFQVERLANPDSEELSRGIEKFIGKHGYDSENRLLIFFSGHGHSANDKGFILPVDAPLPDDRKAFRRKALPMTQVMAWARDIESKHVLFVFDSCFSGSVFSSKNIPSVEERYIRKATSQPVRQFITAGDEKDEVPAKSTFTPLFVKALQGEGDLNNDGYITGSELGVHLVQQVPRYVDQTPQYGKIRDYALSQGDFVFVLQDAAKKAKATDKDQSVVAQLPRRSINESELELSIELELWKSAKQFDGIEDYKAYLEQYPKGNFAAIARNRIKVLKRIQAPLAENWDEVSSKDIPSDTPIADSKSSEESDVWQEITSHSTPTKKKQQEALPAEEPGWQPIK